MVEPQSCILIWEKPEFEVINVSMECTAYAGVLQIPDEEEA